MSRLGSSKLYGSATIGERGQLVIPAEARKSLGIEMGSKVLVFGHGKGLLVLKSETITELLTETLDQANTLEQLLRALGDPDGEKTQRDE
jgi:AbrB family looped-hinge helix DNA binding protein